MNRYIAACGVAAVLGCVGTAVEYVLKDPYGVVIGMTLAIVATFTALQMSREMEWEKA